jgi:hypothetical protein
MDRQPSFLLDRRMLLAGGLMLPGVAVAARLAPPDLEVNEAAIRWPVAGNRELHGFMAIPARARGRQPAIIVIGGPDTSDAAARALVRSVAQAGFIACTPNIASFQAATFADDMRATARWLANGHYGTGRVGGIGMDKGADTATVLTGDGTLAAAVTLGDVTPTTGGSVLTLRADGGGWSLAVGPGSTPAFVPDWPQAWQRVMSYLREHLT